MKCELDVLAVLAQMPHPTMRDIVAKTGISERKFQTVLKTLRSELKMQIKREKVGRNIRYNITGWGVFESKSILQAALTQRFSGKNYSDLSTFRDSRNKTVPTQLKSDFFESVKMRNFIESSRLEGISLPIRSMTVIKATHRLMKKESLIRKYSNNKATTDND
ncbi:YhfG family protein [Microbulbifer sp. HZ11]|uniref:YhfG family protein n=1 Tax=Microbulbifer sp. HZ11 TaxID=1453501 RepID=UPI0005BAC454|nr:YhfG family protein [Microbulbifer sp. HZ11]